MEWLSLLIGIYLGIGIGFMIIYVTDEYNEYEDYSLWIVIPILVLLGVIIWFLLLLKAKDWKYLWKK